MLTNDVAWMVRAGRDGEREKEALAEEMVLVGWPELGDLRQHTSKVDLRAAIAAAYPNLSQTVVSNWAGQLWRLLSVMKIGDLVVLPLKTIPGHVAIGRITGDYEHHPHADSDRRHARPVQWIRREQPKVAIHEDLRHSMESLLTICQISRNGAARRLAVIAETGIDPGPVAEELSGTDLLVPDDLITRARATDDGLPLTVRDLLTAWGAGRRTSRVVAAIERDLAENGLTTIPSFTDGWIDEEILVVRSGAEAEDAATANTFAQPEVDALVVELDPTELDDLVADRPLTMSFGNLLRSGPVVSVAPDATLDRARTLMLQHNYSQLAIIGADGVFHGVVSWESIAKSSMSRTPATCASDARVAAPTAAFDEPVLPRIGEIAERGYVFVHGKDRTSIAGIVTAADLARQFGETAQPFTLVEECERRLRGHVRLHFSPADIKVMTNNRSKDADGLTLGSYMFLLGAAENFERLGWLLDHSIFVSQLESVRQVRNRLMHFSPDPISQEDLKAIEGLLRMLRTVDPSL